MCCNNCSVDDVVEFQIMNMIDYVLQATTEYIERMPKSLRKKYGQFFTSKETAAFMADLLTIPQTSVLSVLDPVQVPVFYRLH